MTKDSDWNETIYEGHPDPTRGRRIARYLSKFNFYSPVRTNAKLDKMFDSGETIACLKKNRQVPKLNKAWDYFEHIGLPRCFKNNEDYIESLKEKGKEDISEGERIMRRAEPGEHEYETMLYPVFGTPLIDLGDFGIGVGLYFSTLRYFAIMAFLAGLINIPALTYFNSDDYSPTGREDLPYLLRLSAICTQDTWQPCPTCTESDWDRFPASSNDRFAVGDTSGLTYIKVNNCRPGNSFGISTYISLIFVILAVYLINYLQRKHAVDFDKNEQTSTDYSIKVNNPPSTAQDPDSWKRFFESAFKDITVNVCTVAINNQGLVRALIDRRKFLVALEDMLPREKNLDVNDLKNSAKECRVPLLKKIFCCGCNSPERLVAKIQEKEIEIVEQVTALRKECSVTSVFVTFDTEQSQRTVLEELTVARRDEKDVIQEKLFCYKQGDEQIGRVLRIVEPDEPSSIRWEDLDDAFVKQYALQILTMLVTTGLIFASGFLIAWAGAGRESTEYTAITITMLSVIIPMIVGFLITFESHDNETSRTSSRYLKITVFRWLITVIIPLVIISFADTLDGDDLIKSIYGLFISELIRRPVFQIIDIIGTLKRHILGPRAEDQRRMDLYFSGTSYNIGERYTEISKILFLTLFYSILFPMGFFFASAIFTVYYWMDKFCILRSWKQGPKLGVAVSTTSAFFFKLCLLTYAVMASYFYSQFPADNACLSNKEEDFTAYTGSVTLTPPNDKPFDTQIDTETVQGYKFCTQELLRSMKFPALPSLQSEGGWMTPNQELYSKMFGWTSVAMLVLAGTSLLNKIFMYYVYPIFYSPYQRPTYENNEKFEEVQEIAAYVPQVVIPGFKFPFLLCDTKGIDHDMNHIGWNDPETSFSNGAHNLSFDVSSIIKRQGGNITSDSPIFSIVKSYKEREDGRTIII